MSKTSAENLIQALENELATPMVYIKKNGVYYEVPKWMKDDLEVLEIIKSNTIIEHEDDEFPDFSIMFTKDQKEECKKLREWLENE